MRRALAHAHTAQATVAAAAADELLARGEAELLLRGATHPIVAAGLLHYCRHLILQPGVHEELKVLRIVPVHARMVLFLAERWPLLAPNALSYMRSCLQLSPAFVDATALAPCRAAVTECLAQLAMHTGYCLPTVTFVQHSLAKGGMESTLGRIFLSRVVERLATTTGKGVPSSVSMPLALALCYLIEGLQSKLKAQAESNAVGAIRRAEGILLPDPGIAMAFEVLMSDMGRTSGLLQRLVPVADILADKGSGWTAQQRELARLLAGIDARRKEGK
jgi:hypothetical protein